MQLTITASVNGRPILATTIEAEKIPDLLAKHSSMDDWVVGKGGSLDEARDAMIENLKRDDIAQHLQVLVPTLLWLACRGQDGKTCEEAVRHGGVTLAFAFHELPGDRATMQCALLPPSTQ